MNMDGGKNQAHEENGRLVGEGVSFDRIRRITGYLVGTLKRFNNAKRAEVRDRVKHDARPQTAEKIRG